MSEKTQAVGAPLERQVRPLEIAAALRAAYQQGDMDGVMVLVSRQACDEGADWLERLEREAEVRYYVREHRKDAEVRANREKSLLSNLFAHGIDLGVCKENPAKHVRPNIEEPRTEAPDAEVLMRFLAWVETQTLQRRIIGLAAEYASLAGNRKAEFLDLAWPQVDRAAGEIRIKRAKQRGKKRGEVIELIAISPALENCLDRLAKIRPARDCLYVFPTRDNNAYTSAGFKTLWQRVVLAAIAAKVISAETRFTFHDLRAHYVTVHKADTGKLPDMHKNPETTARVYDRNKIVRRTSN